MDKRRKNKKLKKNVKVETVSANSNKKSKSKSKSQSQSQSQSKVKAGAHKSSGKEKETEKKSEKKQREVSVFREYFELITEVMVLVFFIHAFLFQIYVIPTSSMEETMLVGDHLLMDKVAYASGINAVDSIFLPHLKLQRGMIVGFSGPNEINHGLEARNLVKRVVGLPGDTIKVIGGNIILNNKLQDEPYKVLKGAMNAQYFPPEDNSGWSPNFPVKFYSSIVDTPSGRAFKVPPGHYFCMGDNRNNSSDSRDWGPVPAQYIIGKPWRVYWSYEASTQEYLSTGVWNKIKGIFSTIVNFYSRTRWERTFKRY